MFIICDRVSVIIMIHFCVRNQRSQNEKNRIIHWSSLVICSNIHPLKKIYDYFSMPFVVNSTLNETVIYWNICEGKTNWIFCFWFFCVVCIGFRRKYSRILNFDKTFYCLFSCCIKVHHTFHFITRFVRWYCYGYLIPGFPILGLKGL